MTPASAGPTTATQATPVIELRALRTHADFDACVQLQRETWGAGYTDCVPSSVLKVSQMVGGVSGGAFTPEKGLVGFVYGLTGIRDGRLIHWSHMLAVTPEFRNHGVGRRLKEYQREVLARLGVEMIYWTFDPLVARNAHLNLIRLGAEVQEYVPDMYGDTGSGLHAFGTDRFVVRWPVAPAAAAQALPETAGGAAQAPGETPAAWLTAPVASLPAAALSAAFGGANGPASDGDDPAPVVRIEIPADVESMQLEDALAWRTATRPLFVRLLGDGYRVAGFLGDGHARCYYVLTRVEGAGA